MVLRVCRRGDRIHGCRVTEYFVLRNQACSRVLSDHKPGIDTRVSNKVSRQPTIVAAVKQHLSSPLADIREFRYSDRQEVCCQADRLTVEISRRIGLSFGSVIFWRPILLE